MRWKATGDMQIGKGPRVQSEALPGMISYRKETVLGFDQRTDVI